MGNLWTAIVLEANYEGAQRCTPPYAKCWGRAEWMQHWFGRGWKSRDIHFGTNR